MDHQFGGLHAMVPRDAGTHDKYATVTNTTCLILKHWRTCPCPAPHRAPHHALLHPPHSHHTRGTYGIQVPHTAALLPQPLARPTTTPHMVHRFLHTPLHAPAT